MAIGDKIIIGPGGAAQTAVTADFLDGYHASALAKVDSQIFTGEMRLPDSAQLNSTLPVSQQAVYPNRFATLKAVFDFATPLNSPVFTGTPVLPQATLQQSSGGSLADGVGMLPTEENNKKLATTEWVHSVVAVALAGGTVLPTTTTLALSPVIPLTDDTQKLATTAWTKAIYAKMDSAQMTKATINGLTIDGTAVGGSNPVTITAFAELSGLELDITDTSMALASHQWVSSFMSIASSKPMTRQSILFGKYSTSTGLSDFLTANVAQLTLAADSFIPFVVSYATGFQSVGASDLVDTITAPLTINATTNATNYILINKDITDAVTLIKTFTKPQMGRLATPLSISNGLSWSARTSASPYSDTAIVNTNEAAWYDGTYPSSSANSSGVSAVVGASGMAVGFSSATARMVVGARVVGSNDNGFFSGGNYNLSFTLQGSTSGVDGSWVTLTTKTGVVDANSKSVTFTNPSLTQPYKHYRVVIKHDSGTSHDGHISECIFLEYPHDLYWFDETLNIMKRWTISGVNGSWVQVRAVPIAECVTDNTAITSLIQYAINGYYESDWFDVTTGSSYLINDGVGSISKDVKIFYRGYDQDALVAELHGLDIPANEAHGAMIEIVSESQTKIWTATGQITNYVSPTGYGSVMGGTASNKGMYKVIVKRNY